MRNAITDAQTVLSISGPRPQGNAISNPEIASLNSVQKQVMVNAKAHSLESLSLITSRLRRPL